MQQLFEGQHIPQMSKWELERELERACEAGDVEIVRRVVSKGADPTKVKDRLNRTSLRIACWYVQRYTHGSSLGVD